MSLRLWVSTDHDGHWVGVCSLVVAHDEDEARALLKAKLPEHGLDPDRPFTLQERHLDRPIAYVEQDGDY